MEHTRWPGRAKGGCWDRGCPRGLPSSPPSYRPPPTFPRPRSLANNQFNGSLPAAWSSMGRLLSLDLSGNALSGPLPAPWSRQRWLVRLSLARNSLSGGLPREWASLGALLTLDLAGNKLSGRQAASGRFVWVGMEARLFSMPNEKRFSPSLLPHCVHLRPTPPTQPACRVGRPARGHRH